MIVVAQTVLNTIHQGRAENMWSIWLLFLAVDLLIPGAYALTLHRREIPSIVTLNIQRKDILDPVGRDRVRRKRDNTVGQRLDNEVPQCSCCFFFFLFLLIPRIPSVIAIADFSLGRKLSTFATSLLVHLGRTCA